MENDHKRLTTQISGVYHVLLYRLDGKNLVFVFVLDAR